MNEKESYELKRSIEKIVRQLEYRLPDLYREYKEGKKPEDIVNDFLIKCTEYPVYMDHKILYFREDDRFVLEDLNR